jgi:tetratricopeptide (TPR) repeat protein
MNGGFYMEIKHIFAEMNHKLDQLQTKLKGNMIEAAEIESEVDKLKHQSEVIVDEWLKFEEKLGLFMKGSTTIKKQIEAEETMPTLDSNDYEASFKKLLDGGQSDVAQRDIDVVSWKKGKALYDLHMYDKAIPYLQQVVQEFPEHELATLYLAHANIEGKQYDKAKYYLQFLIDTSDEQEMKTLALHALACTEAIQQHFERALFCFDKIDLKDVKSTWKSTILMNHAQTLYQSKLYEESLDKLIEYYELEPKEWKGPYFIGKVYHEMGNEEAGFAFWFEALQLQQNKELLKKMAKHFEEKTFYQMAAQCYERSMKEHHLCSDEDIWYGLAWNYGLSHQKEKSEEAFLKSLCIFPNNIRIQISYIWMLFYWGQSTEAKKGLALLSQEQSGHPLVQGLVQLSQGDFEQAVEILHDASQF